MFRTLPGNFTAGAWRIGFHGPARPLRVGLLLTAVLAFASDALAESVLLVHPEPSEGVIAEAFNRLRGELGMHGFEVIAVSERGMSETAGSSAGRMAQGAEGRHAAASVYFNAGPTGPSADICLSEPGDGPTRCRRISTERSPAGARLLALRAAELLRASLRKDGSEQSAERDFPMQPRRYTALLQRGPTPRQDSSRPVSTRKFDTSRAVWRVGGELACALPAPPAGAGFGPGVSLGRQVGRRYGVNLVLAGPLLGSFVAVPGAKASLRHELGLFELDVLLWRSSPIRVGLRLSMGAIHLATHGEASLPWLGRSDQGWLGAVGAGFGASLSLAPRLALTFRSRVLVTAPRARVHLAEELRSVDAQLLITGVGLETSF